jgi:hypothetical protein
MRGVYYVISGAVAFIRKVPLPIWSLEARWSRPSSVFRLFPAEDEAFTPLTSTAPPKLAED